MILWSNLDGLSFCVIPFHCQEQLPTATNHRDGTSSGKYREPDDTRDESLSSIQHFWDTNHYQKKYFTSCDPHHDIYTFSYWQIFWHSIWHIFWHSIWHSIWHIFWHMLWHIFWHSIWQIFWRSIWHIFWHSIWHSIWHIFWHSIWPLRSGSAHWDLELVVEVRQCPLGSGAPGWGPAVPTAICNSRLRSGSAHWDLELAVEVRLCPLGSGLRGGGGGWGGGGGGGGEELC